VPRSSDQQSATFAILMDLAREGLMTLKRIVIGIGLAGIAFGIWTLMRAHSQVGTCSTSGAAGATAHTGIDSACVQTLMSYSLGFVFVASGVIIAVIALTMIGRQAHLDLHGELKAVPRTWGTREYVATSNGLDTSTDPTTPALYVVKPT
jgi:hypothetical protein